MALRLFLLGDLRIERSGSGVDLPRSKKTRALLAYLVLTGREHRRDRLCDLLWDVADDPRAALRWVLSRLRKVVDEPDRRRVVANRSSVAFDIGGVHVDVLHARAQLSPGPEQLETAELEGLAEELAPDLLEGLDLDDFDAFQSWLLAQRESVADLRRSVLTALVGRHDDDPAARLVFAQRLAQASPLDEAVRASLARTLVELSRFKEAELQVQAGLRAMREVGRSTTGELRAALRPPESPPPANLPIAPAPSPVSPEPFVGRQAECDTLRDWTTAPKGDDPRTFLVLGETGIGKTRLLDQATLGWEGPVLRGGANEADSRPWAIWLDAFADSPDLRSVLLNADRAANRQEVLDAVCAGLTGPALVVLDDLQWCDAASAELLVAVTERCTAVRLLCAARTGEVEDNAPILKALRGVRRRGQLAQLTVPPLESEEIRLLVSQVAPDLDAAHVVRNSGGNPLFALELARADPAEGLPPTLTGLVRDRLSVLSADAAAALRWASVLGTTFQMHRVQRLAELPDDNAALDVFEELERHGVVAAAPHDTESTYVFANELFRSVIYGELSGPRRRLMHAKVATVLSAEQASDPDVVGALVRHAAAAGDAATASQACVLAGWRCVRQHATAEAAGLARRGHHHAESLPEPAATERKLELWELTLASRRAEDPQRDAAVLVALAQRAFDLGSAEHARLGFHLAAHVHWEHGDFSEAHREAMRAEFAGRQADGGSHVIAQADAARSHLLLERDLGEAEALLLHAEASARESSTPACLSLAMGMLHRHRGFLDQAELCFAEARDTATGGHDPLMEFEAVEQSTMLALQLGMLARAQALSADLVRIGTQIRGGSEGPYAETVRALVQLHGEAQEARATFELCVAAATHEGQTRRLAELLGRAALHAHAQGDPAMASEWATAAARHAAVVGHASWQVMGSVILGKTDTLPPDLLARCSAEARELVARLS